jgi:trans-aconitate methyltransferase
MMMTHAPCQPYRYPFLEYRTKVWLEIIRTIARDCPQVGHLLELGPGYCDFSNYFPAVQKTCIDSNNEMRQYAHPEIRFICEEAGLLSGIDDSSVDLVFASNFLEHLGVEEHQILLPNIRRALSSSGHLALIQPNYRLNPDHYFDDQTHRTIFSDQNIEAFLERFGFTVIKLIPRFLPFSMKSRLPKWPILVRLYLASPVRPFAGQMYILAQKR